MIYPAVPIDETARLANFPYNKWADTAIEVSLKGVQVEGDVKYNYPSLAKLVDGVYADDATEFSDSRLISFQWENFSKDEGAQNGTKEFSLILDLAEEKLVTGVKLGAYKDLNSYINLPGVKIYLSNDGVNYVSMQNAGWASTVTGLVDATERTSGLKGGCTLSVNWAVRALLKARYVKVVLTMDDEWVFLSEFEAITAAEGTGAPVDQVRLSGVNTKLVNECVVILTDKIGTLPLAVYVKKPIVFLPTGDLA